MNEVVMDKDDCTCEYVRGYKKNPDCPAHGRPKVVIPPPPVEKKIEPPVSTPVLVGTVVRLFADKGYGFLRGGDGQQYYFHRNAVGDPGFDELRQNDSVTYIVGSAPLGKGPRAQKVKRLAV